MQYARHESVDGSPLKVDRNGYITNSGIQYQNQVTRGISRAHHERRREELYYPDGTLKGTQSREWVEIVSGGPGTALREYDRSDGGIVDALWTLLGMCIVVAGSFGAFGIGGYFWGFGGGVALVFCWICGFLYYARQQ